MNERTIEIKKDEQKVICIYFKQDSLTKAIIPLDSSDNVYITTFAWINNGTITLQ